MLDSRHSSDRRRSDIIKARQGIAPKLPITSNQIDRHMRQFKEDYSLGNNQILSIIIPAFNAADYVQECLSSICQSAVNSYLLTYYDMSVEIIVGFDGCEDTKNAIDADILTGCSMRFFESPVNVGTYIMLNSLYGKTHGMWIGVVGADDSVRPSWINDIVSGIKDGDSKNVVAVNTLFETTNDEGKHESYSNTPPNGCWFYRRDFLYNALGAFNYPWRFCADAEMYTRSHFGWRANEHIVNVPSYKYRRHVGQLSDIVSRKHNIGIEEYKWCNSFVDAERRRYEAGGDVFVPHGAITTFLKSVKMK